MEERLKLDLNHIPPENVHKKQKLHINEKPIESRYEIYKAEWIDKKEKLNKVAIKEVKGRDVYLSQICHMTL